MKAKKLCLMAGIVCSLFAPSVRYGGNEPAVKEISATGDLADTAAGFSMKRTAHVGEAWYPCRVVHTGGAWGNGYIQLTHDDADPCFLQLWFKLPDGRDKQMCALAAIAKQDGDRVTVCADISRGVYPTISDMRLIR